MRPIAHYLLISDQRRDALQLPCFFEVELAATNLEEWTGSFPFKVTWSPGGALAEFKRMPLVEHPLPAAKANLVIGTESYLGSGDYRRLVWRSSAIVSVRRERPASFWKSLRILRSLQEMLSVLIGEPIRVEHVSLRGAHIDDGRRSTTHVLFKPIGQPDVLHNDRDMFMLLPRLRLGQQLSQVANQWFRKYESLKTLVGLLLAVQGKNYTYQEAELVTLIQGLESFSRATGSLQYMTRDEYASIEKEQVAAIPARVPDALRERLKNVLKYGNEYSLRKRLTVMLNVLGSDAQEQVHPQIEAFVEQVVDARNHVTHRPPERKRMTGLALYDLNRRLEVMITHLVLAALGVPAPEAIAAVRRSRRLALGITGGGGSAP